LKIKSDFSSHGDLCNGAFINTDPGAGLKGKLSSKDGEMFSLRLRAKPGIRSGWQAFHLQLGNVNLLDSGVICVMLKTLAPVSVATKVCFRTLKHDGFVDTFFPKTLVSFGQPSVHLDMLDLDSRSDIPLDAANRELILFFQSPNMEFTLQDMRVAIL